MPRRGPDPRPVPGPDPAAPSRLRSRPAASPAILSSARPGCFSPSKSGAALGALPRPRSGSSRQRAALPARPSPAAPGPRSPCLAEHFQERFAINPEVPERPEESQERAQQYGYYRMIFGKKVLMGNLVFILKLLTMIFLW